MKNMHLYIVMHREFKRKKRALWIQMRHEIQNEYMVNNSWLEQTTVKIKI